MRQGARPGTPDRLAARRVASPWLTQGKGYLRLNVRDGFVVAGEYGWLAEEVVLETAGGDEPLRTDVLSSSLSPVHARVLQRERAASLCEPRVVVRTADPALVPAGDYGV